MILDSPVTDISSASVLSAARSSRVTPRASEQAERRWAPPAGVKGARGPGQTCCCRELGLCTAAPSYQYDMLLKCSVNWVKLGLFSSFCSFAQSKTSGICKGSGEAGAGALWLPDDGQFLLLRDQQQLLPPGQGTVFSRPQPCAMAYLYFIEELSIQQGQLLGYFMAVKVMQSPRPRREARDEQWGQGQWEVAGCRPVASELGSQSERPPQALHHSRRIAASEPTSGRA